MRKPSYLKELLEILELEWSSRVTVKISPRYEGGCIADDA